MTFYSSISRYYDEIFPFDAQEMAFVKKRLDECVNGGKLLLDVGCGTGNKTVHLAGPERFVVAIDGDAAMIREAEDRHARPEIEYRVLDMTAVGASFPAETFDALLCLGNTLAHLPGPDAVARLLADLGAVLKPGGLAVIQILNYDRVLDRALHDLPLLESDAIRFERRYAFQDCEMRFVTRLTVKQTGEIIENSIPLYPLRKRELNAMLGEAGFLEAEHYGSYRGEPFTPESFPLIAVARKA